MTDVKSDFNPEFHPGFPKNEGEKKLRMYEVCTDQDLKFLKNGKPLCFWYVSTGKGKLKKNFNKWEEEYCKKFNVPKSKIVSIKEVRGGKYII